MFVVMITAAIIIRTPAAVNNLDGKLPADANIHTTPIIKGTMINPLLICSPPILNPYPKNPEYTMTFCEKINSPTTSIANPAKNCNSSFLAFFILTSVNQCIFLFSISDFFCCVNPSVPRLLDILLYFITIDLTLS